MVDIGVLRLLRVPSAECVATFRQLTVTPSASVAFMCDNEWNRTHKYLRTMRSFSANAIVNYTPIACCVFAVMSLSHIRQIHKRTVVVPCLSLSSLSLLLLGDYDISRWALLISLLFRFIFGFVRWMSLTHRLPISLIANAFPFLFTFVQRPLCTDVDCIKCIMCICGKSVHKSTSTDYPTTRDH